MDRLLATVGNQKQQRLKGARFVRQDLAATLEQPLKVFLWTRAGKNLDARRGPSGLQGILEGLLSFVQDEDRRSHRRRSNRRGQDRKSVVKGKRVSVRVDLGGRRNSK